MIYLRDRKLLFFKPRKTAGTSFEIALSRHAGPQDIVTPLVLGDELLRRRLGGHRPVNWATPEVEAEFEAAVAREGEDADPDQVLFPLQRARYFHHISPGVVAERGGGEMLESATVVTMCRHPYDVLVSQILYFKKFQKRSEDFGELLERFGAGFRNNLPYYGYKGRFLPKVVIRYENLEADLQEFDRAYGFDLSQHFPETKKVNGIDRPPAREMLGEKWRRHCYRRNRLIFDIFGYEP